MLATILVVLFVCLGCPGESVAFVDMTGLPKECSPHVSYCPTGYSCQRTKTSKYQCCTVRNTSREIDFLTSIAASLALSKKSSKNSRNGYSRDMRCLPSQVLVNGECR